MAHQLNDNMLIATSSFPTRRMLAFSLVVALVCVVFVVPETHLTLELTKGRTKRNKYPPSSSPSSSPPPSSSSPSSSLLRSPHPLPHIVCSSGCVNPYKRVCSKLPLTKETHKEQVTNMNGTILVLNHCNPNVNHAFHEAIWPTLADGILSSSTTNTNTNTDRNSSNSSSDGAAGVTIFYSVDQEPSSWVLSFLDHAVQTYGWKLVPAVHPSGWFCTTATTTAKKMNPVLIGTGKVRYYKPELLRMVQNDLRPSLPAAHQDDASSLRERIVIYTRRNDSEYRQLHNIQPLVNIFDEEQYDIKVVDSLTESFEEQQQLFGSASLFIAPNGGWSPNVLWMQNKVCLVELHLYREDSWIGMFGLSALFIKGRFWPIVGNYSGLEERDRLHRPDRWGGDDTLFGHLVAPDVRAALRKSSDCRRFLKP